MRLVKIAGRARGRDFALELRAPVTVVLGPTGAGKTTLLQAGQWCISGQVGTGGKPVVRPGDVHQMLAADASDVVSCEDTFDHDGTRFLVERTLAESAKGATQDLVSTLAPKGAALRAVEDKVAQVIGRPAALDIGTILAMGPQDRRKALLDACAGAAPAWPVEQVTTCLRKHVAEAVTELQQRAAADAEVPAPSAVVAVCGPFGLMPGEGSYDAARRFATTAHEKKKELDRRVADARKRVEQAAKDVELEPADLDELRARRDGLQQRVGEAEAAQRDSAGRARRIEQIEQEIARLEALPSEDTLRREADDAGRDVTDLRAEAERLRARLAELEGAAVAGPDAELGAALAEALRVLDQAERVGMERAAAADRLRTDIEKLGAGGDGICPCCRQAIGEDAIAALQDELVHAARLLETARAVVQAKQEDVELVREEIAAAERRAQRAAAERAQRLDALRRELRGIEADLSIATQRQGRAEGMMQGAADAGRRLAEVRQELQDLRAGQPAGGAVALDELRVALRQADAILQQAAYEAGQADQANAAMDELQRLEVQAVAAALSAKAWAAVVIEYGQASVGPFADAVRALLPETWSMQVDMATAAMTITRTDREAGAVPVEALSRGETVMLYAAASAALAVVSGAPWRCAWVDHAEGLTDAPDDSAQGLLEVFVRRLADTVSEGHLDQAVVATGRLTEHEVQTLEEMGVDIVRIGDLSRPVETEAEIEQRETEALNTGMQAEVSRIDPAYYTAARRALRPVSDANVRAIVEALCVGADLRDLPKSGPAVKARAVCLLAQAGVPLQDVLDGAASFNKRKRAGRQVAASANTL